MCHFGFRPAARLCLGPFGHRRLSMAGSPTDEDREVEELAGRLAELGVSVVIASVPLQLFVSFFCFE